MDPFHVNCELYDFAWREILWFCGFSVEEIKPKNPPSVPEKNIIRRCRASAESHNKTRTKLLIYQWNMNNGHRRRHHHPPTS